MLKPLTFALASAVALNAVLVFVGRGDWGFQLLTLAAAFWIVVAIVVAGVAIPLLFRKRWPVMRRVGTISAVVAAVAASGVVSIPLGARVNRLDIDRAKAFCDGLRPELERQRLATGRYPDQPFSDSLGLRPPRLLREVDFYRSHGDHYAFSFTDPSKLFGFVDFDSREGAWVEWED